MNNLAFTPFSFVQFTDPQLGFGEYEQDLEHWRLSVERINLLQPDFVLLCGDLVHDPYDAQAWQDFFDAYAALDVPCYVVPGNHDIGLEEIDPMLLRAYREKIGSDNGTFEHKRFRFIWINTQFWKDEKFSEETQAHDRWLESCLESAREQSSPIIVAGHHPCFLAQPDEPDEYFNLPQSIRLPLIEQFKASGVRAYLSGHRHIPLSHTHQQIKFVTAASTARNFDDSPPGFNLWSVDEQGELDYEVILL